MFVWIKFVINVYCTMQCDNKFIMHHLPVSLKDDRVTSVVQALAGHHIRLMKLDLFGYQIVPVSSNALAALLLKPESELAVLCLSRNYDGYVQLLDDERGLCRMP